MVAHVLGLRIALLFGAVRGRPRQVARAVAGLVALVLATAAACTALLTLRDAPTDVAQTVIVLAGSAVTLGFALWPLVLGAADPLDPRRFAVFGLPVGPLTGALALASLFSVPTLAVLAAATCVALVWIAHDVPVPVAVLGAVLGALGCVLFARVSFGLAALVFRERRSRELSGVFVLALLVIVVPVVVFLASLEWKGRVPSQLESAAEVLGTTPLGAAWALPGRIDGAGGSAWIAGIISALTLAALWFAWVLLVRTLLTTTERPVSVKERAGLGWFAVAPGTPAGAVAARSLVYWMRDRRYLVNIVAVPIGALLTVVPLLVAGVPLAVVALIPVPIMALLLGWLPHNDVAYDNTAIWMHIASGLRGVSDRVGRLVPILMVGVPVLIITIPVSIAIHGRWALLPAMVGVCGCLFFAGLGLSSVSSVAAPYAVARPGDSPFQQPQRTGSAGASAQALVLLGALVATAPALWFAWLALTQDMDYAMSALWSGLGVGFGVLLVGLAIGSALFSRRSDRLMEFAESA